MPVSTFLLGATEAKLYSTTDGVKQESGIADLQTATDWAEYGPLWAARGKAIQGYAQLERSLCSLLVAVGDVSWKVAVTIFYKITNTSARNAILEKLLHQKCGQKYNQFWNPYVAELRQIDLRRNAIVHWLAAGNVLMNSENVLITGVTLIPPASVVLDKSSEHITTRDLVEFAG